MNRTSFVLVLICLGMGVSINCGTIVQGTTQDVVVSTTPAYARVWVDGVEQGKTPDTLRLRRKDDHTIRLVKEGYKDVEIKLVSSVSAALFGNIIFGGLIGCIIDCSNGAGYELSPDEIVVDLLRVSENSGGVILLDPDRPDQFTTLRVVNERGDTELLMSIGWGD